MSVTAKKAETIAEEAVNNAENPVWLEPDMSLVQADDTEPPPFDFEALPPEWGAWCKETAEAKGCPVDYVAANLLVSSSAWLGNSRRVSPTYDWIEPPHIWIADIGKPSEGKTPSQEPFIEISKILEREEEPAWKKQCAEYENASQTATAKIDKWKKDVKEAVNNGTTSPARPHDAILPERPVLPRVIIADATTQETVNILAGNPKGIFLVRDELAGWIGSFDRYTGAGADRGFYLECWNGGRYSVDLVKHSGVPVRVPYASLAILGGMQPDKLQEAVSGADDGFAARFGYVWPKPVPFRNLKREDDSVSEKRRDMLLNAARRLRGLQMKEKDNGDIVAHILRLSPDAMRLFEEIRREATDKARNTKGLAAGWHGKTPARALRIALTMEFLAWALDSERNEPKEISATSMAYAGTYLDYLALMFERVIGGISIGRADADAADIARSLKKNTPTILNERELYQSEGFSYLRENKRRKDAFDVLERSAWIRRLEHNGKGRRRADWEVNPKIYEV